MKKIAAVLSLALLGLFTIFSSSCKKDFNEEDAIRLQDSLQTVRENTRDSLLQVGGIINYSVNVVSVGNSVFGKSVNASGALVTVAQHGVVVSKTTGAEGIATFDDMRVGNVAVHVQLADHTTADFIADLTPNTAIGGPGQDVSGTIRYAATLVPMFPTTGTSVATIRGKISVESNLVNNTREIAAGAQVIGVIDVTSPDFEPYIATMGGSINTDNAGKIISIAFSNAGSVGTADALGEFTLTVPGTAQGLPIKLEVIDYVADQSILLLQLHGQDVYGTQTIRTTFSNGVIVGTPIPTVLAAYVTISPPTGAIGVCTSPAGVTPNIVGGAITSYTVLPAGSGYTATPNIVINSATGVGASATAVLDPLTGGISSVNVVSGGNGYIAATVSPVISLYHQTAKAHATITPAPNGNISAITLDAVGLGYITPPTITITPSVAGMGSAATAEYTVNPTGALVGGNILMTNGGSGYLGTNSPATAQGVAITPAGASFNVYSGGTYIKDVYLGTGVREITW